VAVRPTYGKEALAVVGENVKEFGGRVRSYQSHFKITGDEAVRRVAQYDPKMKALYESDPFGPVNIIGVQPAPAVANITVPAWTPEVHESLAVSQIANILFNLPRDEFGYNTLDQARWALKPYPDAVDRAAGDTMDARARAEIHIQGMPGSVSENYPRAIEAAWRRFPALKDLEVGRISSQGLRELLPQILIRD